MVDPRIIVLISANSEWRAAKEILAPGNIHSSPLGETFDIQSLTYFHSGWGKISAAAIAWVAKRNRVRCLIVRGVTDLVSSCGGEAYGNIELFHENTRTIMKTLVDGLPRWLAKVTWVAG